MKALGWNCQGMGKSLGSPKMCHLARMIHSTKAQVIFVSEIKSSKIQSNDLTARFNMADSFVVPSRRRSGGLWLMWNDDLQVNVHSSSFHVILATIINRSTNQQFGLVCIYGDPYHHESTGTKCANRSFSARTKYLAGGLKIWCRKKNLCSRS